MTLSAPTVLKTLKQHFVCGWTNIKGKASYAGTSNVHDPDFRASRTTNCAGHHNVQMFFLTPSGEVVHCLPGFWGPKAFLSELQLAIDLGKVHADTKLSTAQKYDKFLDLHLDHALSHSGKVWSKSSLQFFDVEQVKVDPRTADFRRPGGKLKRTDQVVHERMADRPFFRFERFDVHRYVAMGLKSFDSHADGCDHGSKVRRANKKKRAAKIARREAAIARRAAKRKAARERRIFRLAARAKARAEARRARAKTAP